MKLPRLLLRAACFAGFQVHRRWHQYAALAGCMTAPSARPQVEKVEETVLLVRPDFWKGTESGSQSTKWVGFAWYFKYLSADGKLLGISLGKRFGHSPLSYDAIHSDALKKDLPTKCVATDNPAAFEASGEPADNNLLKQINSEDCWARHLQQKRIEACMLDLTKAALSSPNPAEYLEAVRPGQHPGWDASIVRISQLLLRHGAGKTGHPLMAVFRGTSRSTKELLTSGAASAIHDLSVKHCMDVAHRCGPNKAPR